MSVELLKQTFGKIWLVIFIFIFIYDPPIALLGGNFTTFFALPSTIILFTIIITKGKIPKNVYECIPIFSIICICLVISLFWPLLANTNDYVLFKTYVIFLTVYFPTIFIIIYQFKYFRLFKLKILFQIIVWICTIQSIIMLIMFINPDIKQSIFSILRDDRSIINMQSGGVRMLGLAYSVLWDLSFLQSLSLIIMVPLVARGNMRENLLYAFCYLLIFLSIVFAGRTGFIGVAISIFYFTISFFTKRKNSLKSFTKFFVSFLLLISIGLSAYTFLLPAQSREIVTDKVLPWAFELFLSKSESGKFGTESSDEMQKMYFPVELKTLLVGDARYVDANDPTHYYRDTDAGYMRHMLFYGVFGSLFIYGLYLVLFSKLISKSVKNNLYFLAILYSLILVYFFIGHIKGDLFVGGSMVIRLIFLIYVFSISIKDEDFSF